MNALPELKPITVAVVTHPKFDNRRLRASLRTWVSDNSESLQRYYTQQTEALDPEERLAGTDDDFDVWLLVQYDLELRRWGLATECSICRRVHGLEIIHECE